MINTNAFMKAGFLEGKLSTARVIKDADNIFHSIRWNGGVVVCPYCGEKTKIYQAKNGGYSYKCGCCGHKFTDRTKTLLHGSKLSTAKWLQGIYEVFTSKGISSIELANKLVINQKSAWLMLSKIRYGLEQKDILLEGVVAQDEMYIGGSLHNYHFARKLNLLRKNCLIKLDEKKYDKGAIMALNAILKQPVFGLNDGKQIVLQALPNPLRKEYLHQIFTQFVGINRNTVAVADTSELYVNWEEHTGSQIETNNHHKNQYQTKSGLSSNRIENTFSWYKRGFACNYTHVKYQQLYLNEFVFRYNTRKVNYMERFFAALKNTIGNVATYKTIKESNHLNQFQILQNNALSNDEIAELLNDGIVQSVTQNHKTYTLDNVHLLNKK